MKSTNSVVANAMLAKNAEVEDAAPVAENAATTEASVTGAFSSISRKAQGYIAKAHELETLCKALRAEFVHVREEAGDAWDDNNIPAQVLKAFKDTRKTLLNLSAALNGANRTLFIL